MEENSNLKSSSAEDEQDVLQHNTNTVETFDGESNHGLGMTDGESGQFNWRKKLVYKDIVVGSSLDTSMDEGDQLSDGENSGDDIVVVVEKESHND